MPTFYNPFETKHRRRTSRAQFKLLETSFYENTKPNATMRRWLAQKLGMTPRSVQVWFQNRRAKAK
ncbi:Homeodomain-like protein, partial [Halteromyces radiatus]|uniref:Homeodomain-like protein n=1 Tax=Halteromyces radiatus TaxID=101107 RepID=UPI002220082D